AWLRRSGSRSATAARTRVRSFLAVGVECVSNPVAEQVEPEDSDEDRGAGNDAVPGVLLEGLLRVLQHQPERGVRRLDAEPEETQAGLGKDRKRHRERELDEQRRECVREDDAEEQPTWWGAVGLARLNEVRRLQSKCLGPHEAGEVRHEDEP